MAVAIVICFHFIRKRRNTNTFDYVMCEIISILNHKLDDSSDPTVCYVGAENKGPGFDSRRD